MKEHLLLRERIAATARRDESWVVLEIHAMRARSGYQPLCSSVSRLNDVAKHGQGTS